MNSNFLYSNFIGISYAFNETDEVLYFPFQRLQEFIKSQIEDKLKSDELIRMRRDIDKIKEKCTRINIKGKVQFDLAMEILI